MNKTRWTKGRKITCSSPMSWVTAGKVYTIQKVKIVGGNIIVVVYDDDGDMTEYDTKWFTLLENKYLNRIGDE